MEFSLSLTPDNDGAHEKVRLYSLTPDFPINPPGSLLEVPTDSQTRNDRHES